MSIAARAEALPFREIQRLAGGGRRRLDPSQSAKEAAGLHTGVNALDAYAYVLDISINRTLKGNWRCANLNIKSRCIGTFSLASERDLAQRLAAK
jgi:hypothetical protein